MLFNASPLSLGFVMIDPKQTELNMYNELPHLLQPIVTDTKEAIIMLKKMCAEMDRRYSEMKEGKTFQSKIVIVIDELADLMMTSGKEVEKYLCRLAQMGRAAGIHLIVATQNPKAEILTTMICGNLPARIVFKVAEKTEELVLDMPGATKLIGRGDGIFKDPSRPTEPIRFQSAFIDEDDIKRIVDYWKSPAALRSSIIKSAKTKTIKDDATKDDINLKEDITQSINQLSSSDLEKISAMVSKLKDNAKEKESE